MVHLDVMDIKNPRAIVVHPDLLEEMDNMVKGLEEIAVHKVQKDQKVHLDEMEIPDLLVHQVMGHCCVVLLLPMCMIGKCIRLIFGALKHPQLARIQLFSPGNFHVLKWAVPLTAPLASGPFSLRKMPSLLHSSILYSERKAQSPFGNSCQDFQAFVRTQ